VNFRVMQLEDLKNDGQPQPNSVTSVADKWIKYLFDLLCVNTNAVVREFYHKFTRWT
jgi:hypothetical protein